MPQKSARPIHLDLRRIRLPVTAVVSLLHRASGILLFLSLPFLVYLLDLSLRSETGYQHVVALLDAAIVKIMMFFVLWSVLHHLFAGLRFLLIDVDVGVQIEQARKSAKVVFASAIVATIILGAWLL